MSTSSAEVIAIREKVEQIHLKVAPVFEDARIPSMTRKEYVAKSNQYKDMYESLETMKSLSSDEKTISNLERQQIEVLTTWEKFEIDILKRML